MIESWRWYGPLDKIEPHEIAQTGATGIVTALHEIPYGVVWDVDAIEARKGLIGADPSLGLHWNVVESLPIHEDIKRGEGDLDRLFGTYRQSLANLAACGVKTICYNFMPLLDWTRTELDAPVRGGGTALRFNAVRMAAFELFMLNRPEAADDYPAEVIEQAKVWFQASDEAAREVVLSSIMAGLPGAFDRYTVDTLREALKKYEDIDRDALRDNYARFLAEIMPTCDDLGMKMCVHPDDPPRDILGLPRIVSNADDIAWLMGAENSASNGLTLCSGSLGANPANDIPAIATRFADRIHFAHLRNVSKDPDGSFQESEHLGGDNDMVAIAAALLREEKRRKEAGVAAEIPYRPDHGHELLHDLGRDTHPGYPLIGRMRGLAELRGVIHALESGIAV